MFGNVILHLGDVLQSDLQLHCFVISARLSLEKFPVQMLFESQTQQCFCTLSSGLQCIQFDLAGL